MSPAKELRESLEGVIESCVNQVGVDLNTASVPLLRHVSGLNQLVARELVEYRKTNGPFRDRAAAVAGQRHRRAALHPGGRLPQDRRRRQPARRHLDSSGKLWRGRADPRRPGLQPRRTCDDPERLAELREKLKATSPEEVAKRLHAGVPTVSDILDALARPGRDPREDLPPPIFKKGILKLEDLQPGMELKGTVLNVVDFGAFIDIGLKDSGLVHISQMANRYVKSPYDVVAVGDVVTVWVLTVDKERHRVSLTMIPPGTERKPQEKKPEPRERRGERGERGEHGERREGGGRREGAAGGRPPQQRGRRPLPPRAAPRGPGAQGTAGGGAPAQGGGQRGAAPARRSNRRRASRDDNLPSPNCRRRPSPAQRRWAPSPNWPLSGKPRRRKKRSPFRPLLHPRTAKNNHHPADAELGSVRCHASPKRLGARRA